MQNLNTVLKAEISRLSRKEIKRVLTPVRQAAAETRKTVAELKRRLAVMERELKRCENGRGAARAPADAPAPDATRSVDAGSRITGKSVRSLRRRLGLTQAAFAELTDVSPNAVYQWERKSGVLGLRTRTQAKVLEARALSAREARLQLGAKA